MSASSSVAVLLLASLLLLLLSSQAAGQVTSWSSVKILSITSSNCSSISSSQALNCLFPVTAVIKTSGFGALGLGGAILLVTGPGIELGPQGGGGTNLARLPGDTTNTSLVATIAPYAYNPALMAIASGASGPVFNISIRYWWTNSSQGTAPYLGISFAYDPPPTLQTISGCTGNGLSTTGCVPSSTVLTFTGSGFRWFANNGQVQMWISTYSTSVNGNQGGPGGPGGGGPPPQGQPALQVVSDSLLYVNLSAAYVYLLLPPHYNGVVLPVFFNEPSWSFLSNSIVQSYTNSLSLSFIPLPAPVVTGFTAGNGCQGMNGTGPFSNCIPLVSYVNFIGQYMYEMSATVGGVPCAALVPQSASMTRCLLPLVSGTGPFSIQVYDSAGNFTGGQQLISYTSAPTISAVTTCSDTGQTNQAGLWFGGWCQQGQNVVISGNALPAGDSSLVAIFTFNPQGPPQFRSPAAQYSYNITCPLSSVGSSSVTCVLPTPTGNASQVVYGANLQVALYYNNLVSATNSLSLPLYQFPNAPVISSVTSSTGCVSQSALLLSNCVTGAVVTLTGSNFLGNFTVVGPVGSFSWSCAILSQTANSIVCQMPSFDPTVSPVQIGSTYPLVLTVFGPSGPMTSNAFRATFTLASAQTAWSQVQILSVTSSNCSSSGALNINCLFPTTLMITTTGFGGLNLQQAFLIVSGPGGIELGPFGGGGTNLQWNSNDPTNSTLIANIFPSAYNPSLMAASAGALAPVMNISIRSWQQGQTTQVPAVSFAFDAAPSLSTIAGCQSGGPGTYGCVPVSTILTFTGSGFRWFSNQGQVRMWIGASSTPVIGGGPGGGGGQGNSPSLQVVSDSLMYVNLTAAFIYVLLPVHYNGLIVPISFNEQYWSNSARNIVNSNTNQLSISFIPLPPPSVQYVTAGGGCTGVNGTGPFYNCIPLVSWINLNGLYMYEVNATVNGVNCAAITPQSASQTRCLLPALSGPGPYSVVVYDWSGSSTVLGSSSLVYYTTSPTINSVTSCLYTGQRNMAGTWFGGLCQQGQLVTISGTLFVTGDQSASVLLQYNPQGNFNQFFSNPAAAFQYNLSCGSVSVLSASTLTCVLPTPTGNASLAVFGAIMQVQASFSSGAAVTNRLPVRLLQYPNAPVVSQVSGSGCSSQPGLLLTNCPSGASVTISGANLASNWTWVVPVQTGGGGPPAWLCSITSVTASSIVCTMPTFDPVVSPVTAGVLYPVSVGAQTSLGQATSNAFQVSFVVTGTSVTPSSGGGSSGLSTGAIIAIAVVVPVAVVLLALLAGLWLWSRRSGGGGTSYGEKTNFSKHVDSDSNTEVEIQ